MCALACADLLRKKLSSRVNQVNQGFKELIDLICTALHLLLGLLPAVVACELHVIERLPIHGKMSTIIRVLVQVEVLCVSVCV